MVADLQEQLHQQQAALEQAEAEAYQLRASVEALQKQDRHAGRRRGAGGGGVGSGDVGNLVSRANSLAIESDRKEAENKALREVVAGLEERLAARCVSTSSSSGTHAWSPQEHAVCLSKQRQCVYLQKCIFSKVNNICLGFLNPVNIGVV